MASAWNMFVKKIYKEGKAKNADYQFKDALVEASKRKSEMGSVSSTTKKSKVSSTKRRNGKIALTGGKRKTRKARKTHRKH
jgi:hypothetical protein